MWVSGVGQYTRPQFLSPLDCCVVKLKGRDGKEKQGSDMLAKVDVLAALLTSHSAETWPTVLARAELGQLMVLLSSIPAWRLLRRLGSRPR